jgi:hypothetical protein
LHLAEGAHFKFPKKMFVDLIRSGKGFPTPLEVNPSGEMSMQVFWTLFNTVLGRMRLRMTRDQGEAF